MIEAKANTAPVVALLNQLGAHLKDLTPAMDSIATTLLTEVDLAFTTERDTGGYAWAPLKESTLKRRRDQGRDGVSILRDNGLLATSFSTKVTKFSATVGTNDIRAGTHQFGARQGAYGKTRRGGPIPWGDIPARRMLPEPDDRVVQEAVEDALTTLLGAYDA